MGERERERGGNRAGGERERNILTVCPLASQKVIRKERRLGLGSVVITAISGRLFVHQPVKSCHLWLR